MKYPIAETMATPDLNARLKNVERYLRHGIRTVDGWLQPGAARVVVETAGLQKQWNVTGAVAEIGVHEGRFFILLCLLRSEEEEAVAIDVFEQQHLNRDKSGRGNKARLVRNLHRHVSGGKQPILLSADSRDLSSDDLVKAAGTHFRLFSVDGGHEADTVYHDLEIAAGALSEGGVIVLDDYFNEQWPGVCDGTNRFFANGNFSNLAAFAIVQNKVLMSDLGHAERYRHYLAESFRATARIRDSSLFGHPVSYFDFRLGQRELCLMRALNAAVYRYRGLVRLLCGTHDSP